MIFLEITDPTFSWAAPVIVLVATVISGLLAVAIPVLTAVLARYIHTKHGYMVSAEDRAKFDEACMDVVRIVEQNARKALKLGDDAPSGAKKLEEGLTKLEAYLKEEGIYEKFKEVMEDGLENAVSVMNGPLTTAEKDEIRASLPPKEKTDG